MEISARMACHLASESMEKSSSKCTTVSIGKCILQTTVLQAMPKSRSPKERGQVPNRYRTSQGSTYVCIRETPFVLSRRYGTATHCVIQSTMTSSSSLSKRYGTAAYCITLQPDQPRSPQSSVPEQCGTATWDTSNIQPIARDHTCELLPWCRPQPGGWDGVWNG